MYILLHTKQNHLKRELRTTKPPPKKAKLHTCCQPCPPGGAESNTKLRSRNEPGHAPAAFTTVFKWREGKEEQIGRVFFGV